VVVVVVALVDFAFFGCQGELFGQTPAADWAGFRRCGWGERIAWGRGLAGRWRKG